MNAIDRLITACAERRLAWELEVPRAGKPAQAVIYDCWPMVLARGSGETPYKAAKQAVDELDRRRP